MCQFSGDNITFSGSNIALSRGSKWAGGLWLQLLTKVYPPQPVSRLTRKEPFMLPGHWMDPGFLLYASKTHPSLLGTIPALQCRALSSCAFLCGVWTWYPMCSFCGLTPLCTPAAHSPPLTMGWGEGKRKIKARKIGDQDQTEVII